MLSDSNARQDDRTNTRGTYVLITPAYNEGACIEQTIQGVLAQTILPLKWVIVDDGSTDNTAEIIKSYAEHNTFIEYCRRDRKKDQTYYESNVYAILTGYNRVKDLSYDYLAVLDADMVLSADYYERIFKRFDANPELGIATGVYTECVDRVMTEAVIDRQSTPKALQVFRRTCYEKIGNYIPCRRGGEDTCMEILARMHGWQTWSFPDIKTIHLRPVGTGDGGSIVKSRFRQGLTDYSLATHPLFMLAKALRRCFIERPYIISGLARLAGYLYGFVIREPRQIPDDARRYVRREQLLRLRSKLGLGAKQWSPVLNDDREKQEAGI